MTQTLDKPSAEPRSRRFTGLLPSRLLRWRRPVWWQEVAIVAFGYWVYTLGRNAIPQQRAIAFRHGRSIQQLQQWLHLDWELSINRFVARTEWLAQLLDYYYATLHFFLTIGVMVWLFLRRPPVYRGARAAPLAAPKVRVVGFFPSPTPPARALAPDRSPRP